LERALVIGVREDLLFPVDQQREMGQVLGEAGVDCEYVELSSAYGHDAFLTEATLFTPRLSDFLQAIGAPKRYRDTTIVRAPQLNG
jgi:homoserine O-acetyltransferase